MSIDLPYHQSWLEDDEINEVIDTLKSGWLTTGPKTQRFEDDFRAYIGCRHAVGLNSCSAGLHLAVLALGLREGDEVITTPMTFPATTNVLIHEGARPVFADIEPGTLTIDVGRIEEKITPRTRALLPVHYAGHPCDMDAVQELARRHSLFVIEDAAHALEAKYKGRKIGALGNLTSFSFYANKNITTGEGGMLTTNDEQIAEKIRVLRLQGLSRDAWKRYGKTGFVHWDHSMPGFKYNLSDINSALGIHQLKKVERFLKIRKRYAALYDEGFRDVPEVESLAVREWAEPAHHIYVIALDLDRLSVRRDQFLDAVQAAGIGVAVHYVALHLQSFFRKEFHTRPQDYPVATHYSERILSLPLYPKMTPQDVERVVGAVTGLVKKFRR